MEVLRINKWIHELEPQKGLVQIYAVNENKASVIVPLTAFIAYFKKVISLYQHQAENCHVLVLGLVSF